MLRNYSVRTDLALEEKERFEADNVEISGVVLEEHYDEEREIRVTRVQIETENGAKAMGKPVGTYLTLEAPGLAMPDEESQMAVAEELCRCIRELVEKNVSDRKEELAILVAGVFSSCGSRRQEKVILPADFKGPKELSRLYGVRLTPDDNIYLYNAGAHWLGVPHRMGGLTKRGVDCSGFVTIIYREVYGKQLARSAADMLKHDCKRVRRGKLREGDLVFFRTGRGRKREPNHVGIYLKNGRFIHTSTSRGVMVSSLSEPYYERTWICGGRVK